MPNPLLEYEPEVKQIATGRGGTNAVVPQVKQRPMGVPCCPSEPLPAAPRGGAAIERFRRGWARDQLPVSAQEAVAVDPYTLDLYDSLETENRIGADADFRK
jgi:hypothetical protein